MLALFEILVVFLETAKLLRLRLKGRRSGIGVLRRLNTHLLGRRHSAIARTVPRFTDNPDFFLEFFAAKII
ncbi:MAG: hypothetical protein BWY75_03652 [bacterium ADurb.Bin425]|nr:MAG: hypothetical protein BWY75_03652 [bacterium ADurb.Bin425]